VLRAMDPRTEELYLTLGVSPGASQAVIKKAHRQVRDVNSDGNFGDELACLRSGTSKCVGACVAHYCTDPRWRSSVSGW
jgi:hypothetical protein